MGERESEREIGTDRKRLTNKYEEDQNVFILPKFSYMIKVNITWSNFIFSLCSHIYFHLLISISAFNNFCVGFLYITLIISIVNNFQLISLIFALSHP